MSVLDHDVIRSLFTQAWNESQPGTDDVHEEGGFVVQNTDGSLGIERWPRGAQNQIVVPAHQGGKRGDLTVVATFHTHPNPGPNFQQEPRLTDIRAVRDDPHLIDPGYEGEYVIAREWVYRIKKNGSLEMVGQTKAILGIN